MIGFKHHEDTCVLTVEDQLGEFGSISANKAGYLVFKHWFDEQSIIICDSMRTMTNYIVNKFSSADKTAPMVLRDDIEFHTDTGFMTLKQYNDANKDVEELYSKEDHELAHLANRLIAAHDTDIHHHCMHCGAYADECQCDGGLA